jgi:hypothetical protein
MSVATALAARKAQFDLDAAALSDSRLALDATLAIERWYAAASALATAETESVQSYSISGRSVTRKITDNQRNAVDQLRAEVEALLFGGNIKLADSRAAWEGEGR